MFVTGVEIDEEEFKSEDMLSQSQSQSQSQPQSQSIIPDDMSSMSGVAPPAPPGMEKGVLNTIPVSYFLQSLHADKFTRFKCLTFFL